MSDYTDLYKLEVTGGPFQAQFIKKADIDLPPECVLPPNLASIPTLPPIDVVLPALDCKYNVEEPLVPLPYFCSPHFTADIGVSVGIEKSDGSCDFTDPSIKQSGGFVFQRTPNTDCDWELTGGIEICIPCVPQFAGSIDFSTCTIDGHNSTEVGVTTPIKLVYDEGNCLWTLQGAVEICTPCIPSISGAIGIGGGCTIDGFNATQVNVSTPIGLVYNPDTCEYLLQGQVDICSPCVPKFVSTLSIDGGGGSGRNDINISTDPPIEFIYDKDNCKYTLQGDIGISACIPKITFESSVIEIDGGSHDILSASLDMASADGDACDKNITANLTMSLGCVVTDVTADAEETTSNTIDHQAAPTLTLTVDCDGDENDQGCCHKKKISANLTISACSSVTIEDAEDLAVDIPLMMDGVQRGDVKFTLHVATKDAEGSSKDDCTRKLTLTSSGESGSLGFGTSDISICNGDGTTTTITVVTIDDETA